MQTASDPLPAALKSYIDSLPLPGSKFAAIAYDRHGTLHHWSAGANFLLPSKIMREKKHKITDLLVPFLGADPQLFRQKLFETTREENINCLIAGNLDRRNPDFLSTAMSLPAQIKVKEMEGFFVAGIHPLAYFNDRVMSRMSPNMMAILGERDEIVFFSEGFWGAVDESHGGKTLSMEHLTDPVRWGQLVSREKKIQDYYRELGAESGLPWKESFREESADPGQWMSPAEFHWDLKGGEFRTDPENHNAFLTFIPEVDQFRHDVRLEFTIDFSRFQTAGVVFNGDIYRASAPYYTPDTNGYNFAVFQPPQKTYLYLRVKKGGKITDEHYLPLEEAFPDGLPPAEVRLGFQKMGGVFTFFAGGRACATLHDTNPILSTPHQYIALLGGPATRVWGLKIFCRPTRFDPGRIPSETIDLQFYRLPQFVYEARLQSVQLLGQLFRCVYLNEVTQNRRLLQRLNKHVKELDEDLQTAKRIQAFLTDLKPPKSDRVGFACFYKSSGHVGGDMLDVKDLGDGRWAVLIYDVSGHGVAASLICAMAKMSFDNAFKRSQSPSVVAKSVNEDICAVTEPTVFLTAFICVLDLQKGFLEYSRAGHPHPLLFPASGALPKALEAGDSVIGYLPDFEFSNHRMDIAPGDRLLLYTDGLIEARNANRQFLGVRRVVEAVRASREKSLEQVKGEILRLATSFTGENPFEDDMAFILLEVKGGA